ncbi:MAG: hypothetical protein NC400_11025 [Clostridium sp.]|nr:hypothetical protein [Clostridium sp.]
MVKFESETIKGGRAGEVPEIPEKVKSWLDGMSGSEAGDIAGNKTESIDLKGADKAFAVEADGAGENIENENDGKEEERDIGENIEEQEEPDIGENIEEQEEPDIAEDSEKQEELDIAELLDKIYNCDEEDFSFEDFDFEDERLEKILKYFQPEIWNKFDFLEKNRVIRTFAGYLFTKLDIQKAPSIDYCQFRLSMCGCYIPNTNEIKINFNWLNDGKEMLNTIAHEVRHAYQNERAEKLETEMDKMYRFNLDNYVRAEIVDGKYVNFDAYEGQLVEAEARAFADKFVEKAGERS